MRRKQRDAEKMVQQLSAALTSLSAKNDEVVGFWSESALKFKSELEKLQRKGKDAEKARKSLNERNRKLKEKLFNRNEDWKRFYRELGPDAVVNEQQLAELKRLNKLVLSRVDEQKEEIKALKVSLNEEKKRRTQAELERDESSVFAQADAWQQEAQAFKMDQVSAELEAERTKNLYLEQELAKCRQELQSTKQIAISSTQASAESELKVFQAEMRVEQAEESANEAIMVAARYEESLEQMLLEKEGVQKALDAMIAERQKTRLDMAKAIGERDYFEWKLVERSISCVEWMVAPDELIDDMEEEEEGWNSNKLFGTENKLYESL